ncbi:MAG: hypothetical protein AB2385_02280 [Symbiobacterium sp.]|uniref:hypothetical protein n=1 Tax=Symbiobacterium sp. TaxID=1971213 RepID=UPI003464D24C
MLFGGFPIPGITCPSPPFPTPTWSPVGKGLPLPSPFAYPIPWGAPVVTPVTGSAKVPLPTPTAPTIFPSTYPFGVPAIGKAFPFPAAPALNPFGKPFSPAVPSVFGKPFCL